jgi:tRNA A37 threonylcarbamoyladenosine dehydratase
VEEEFLLLYIPLRIKIYNNTTNKNKSQFKTMKKIRAAVVGYGNIGKFAIEALEASEDFEIAGVVRRN